MAAIFEVTVNNSWVDINTVTGLTVGLTMEIMNKGSLGVFITESATEPVEDDLGKLITTVSRGYAVATVLENSDRIWCRCSSPKGTLLAVQEII